MRLTTIFEDGALVIYQRRRGEEQGLKLYVEFLGGQATGNEWKTRTQVVSYLKKNGLI